MSAHNKMAEIVEYVSGKFPSIALDKNWNRLVSDMSKEIEILEDAAEQSAHPTRRSVAQKQPRPTKHPVKIARG